jgi:hypothetical protein
MQKAYSRATTLNLCNAKVKSCDENLETLARGQDLVNQTVLHSLLSGENLVAIDVLVYLLYALAAVLGKSVLEPLTHAHNLSCLDFDIGCLALAASASRGLVNQDSGVWQSEALPLCASGLKYGCG